MGLFSLLNLIAAALHQRQLLTPRFDAAQQVLAGRLHRERFQGGQAGGIQHDEGVAFACTGNASALGEVLRGSTPFSQCLPGASGTLAAFVRALALALQPCLRVIACPLRLSGLALAGLRVAAGQFEPFGIPHRRIIL